MSTSLSLVIPRDESISSTELSETPLELMTYFKDDRQHLIN